MRKVILQEGSNKQHFLTIPKVLVQALGWKKGEILYFVLGKDSSLILTKEEK